MSLSTYRQKRDFGKTPEPRGERQKRTGFSYVIQKHAASHLHYDFRLELDGVLLSWAIPKGPSLDPATKRLAMQTEDHPVEYGSFEGIIPKDQYGGGTVMLWDYGTWEPEGDARKQYAVGRLSFRLKGKKLKGTWHLVRTRRDKAGGERSWLLFKGSDGEARGKESSVVDEQPNSAATGRSLEEIADAQGRVWQSNHEPAASEPRRARAHKTNRARTPKEAGSKSSKRKVPRANGAEHPAGNGQLKLTHPDKVLYPELGITKRELLEYFAAINEWMLPHVKDRPLTLVRCPEGHRKTCFFQKHATERLPAGVRSIPIREGHKDARYMAISNALGLLGLVQMGVLEVHTWGAHADDPERPDLLVFDLDPDVAVAWPKVIDAARLVRDRLEELGLTSFVKTTGGKGLHVCVPIVRRIEWDRAKEFCRRFTEEIVRSAPDEYVATVSKARRKGKIFIDFFRNGRGATFIAPYSTRARTGAPVAVPLAWNELSEDIPGDHFDVRNVPARLQSLKRDPWREMPGLRQSLSASVLRQFGV